MNKIKIVNDEIKIINLNNSIEYEIKDNLIKTLKIEILKDTNLFIDYEFSILAKLEIIIEEKIYTIINRIFILFQKIG